MNQQQLKLSDLLEKVITNEIDDIEFENMIIESMEKTNNEMIVSDLLLFSQSQTQLNSTLYQNE